MADKAKAPIPPWAWIFAVACGIIPILTLGGAIPGAIGFGGAAGCVAVARDATKAVGTRVGLCVAIVVACWVVFLVALGGIAMLSR